MSNATSPTCRCTSKTTCLLTCATDVCGCFSAALSWQQITHTAGTVNPCLHWESNFLCQDALGLGILTHRSDARFLPCESEQHPFGRKTVMCFAPVYNAAHKSLAGCSLAGLEEGSWHHPSTGKKLNRIPVPGPNHFPPNPHKSKK